MGYQVLLPEQHCCGLPLLSKGMVQAAQRKIESNFKVWRHLVNQAEAVVVTCSSCGYALQEEWRNLAPQSLIEAVCRKTMQISQLVEVPFEASRATASPLKLAYHHPCHLKIQATPNCSVDMLAALPGISLEALKTHCCGMAGSWGLKAANYDLSRTISGDLIHQLETSEADYGITDCPTCRMQMEHFSRLPIRHPVEIVAERLLP